MATTSPPRKDTPEYSLDRIKALGQSGQVFLLNPETTLRQMDTYSYDMQDLRDCLAGLRADEFRHSEFYDDVNKWNDVYKVEWRNEKVDIVEFLYVKVRLNRDESFTVVVSFHPEGAR
jgi:hypothetical protein